MPSASGVYSLPPGYLAVTGQPILASQHNPPLEDIAAALTLRLSRDGSAPMTGPIKALPGTPAVPSYTFSTDPTSGLIKTTNGIGVVVGGAQVAEFTATGLATGIPGQIIAWSRTSLPSALWVWPVGQTLSRTAYPTLWTAAQVEIAAGNTFYNNGNGSTTFGIGDLRGRTLAAIDNMGGSDAGLLNGSSIAANRTTVGAAGGTSTVTLNAGQIPAHTHPTNEPPHAHTNDARVLDTAGALKIYGTGAGGMNNSSLTTSATTTGLTVLSNTGGGGAHDNLQPTLLCTFILFAGS